MLGHLSGRRAGEGWWERWRNTHEDIGPALTVFGAIVHLDGARLNIKLYLDCLHSKAPTPPSNGSLRHIAPVTLHRIAFPLALRRASRSRAALRRVIARFVTLRRIASPTALRRVSRSRAALRRVVDILGGDLKVDDVLWLYSVELARHLLAKHNDVICWLVVEYHNLGDQQYNRVKLYLAQNLS